MANIRTKAFIIDFLESIEQPLTEKQKYDIIEGEKLLKEQKEAIEQMLKEEF
jgi:hypothetical protein